MTEIDTNILEKSGLTQEQAEIYSFLLSNGLSPAKLISKQTSIGRALTYKILDRLIELGLAEKREGTGKITMFFPGHPSRIKDLVEKEKTIANEGIILVNIEMASLAMVFSFSTRSLILDGWPGKNIVILPVPSLFSAKPSSISRSRIL